MADKTIVALYDDFRDAARAVRELERGGFVHKDISLVANNAERRWGEKGERLEDDDTYAAEGAGTGATIGAVAGGAAGLLASLGVLAIPGIGPVLAAGPLVATLTGAGLGAAAGGLIGGLVGAGVPEHEAHLYAEGVRRGGALVTIRVGEKHAERAVDILERHDAVDVDQRQAGWRSQGWQAFDQKAEPWDVRRIDEERTRWRAAGAAGPVAGGASQTTGAGFAATTIGAAMRAPSGSAAAEAGSLGKTAAAGTAGRATPAARATTPTGTTEGSHGMSAGAAGNAGMGGGTSPVDYRNPNESRSGRQATSQKANRKKAANDRGVTDLRSGTIVEESDTARMKGRPQRTAMSEEPGSAEGLREQKESLKKGDTGRGRVRSYSGVGEITPDRAAAGDKPRK